LRHLAALKKRILDSGLVQPEKLHAYATNIRVPTSQANLGAGHMELAHIRYLGVISIEQYSRDGLALLALLAAHRADMDAELSCKTPELDAPEIDVSEAHEDGTVDIDITVDLHEPIMIREAEDGWLEMGGKCYTLTEGQEIWLATYARVFGRDSDGVAHDWAPLDPLRPDIPEARR